MHGETPSPRTLLLAPDAFKGTFTAAEIVAALAPPFEAAGRQVDRCPLADGGEGTTEVLLAALGGERVSGKAHDPLGRPIEASFAVLGDGVTAVVETAAASGLALVAEEERDPVAASSRGTGELILAAAARGAGRILVGVGGSASTDGGAGAIAAIDEGGGIPGAELVCLCDVRTAWEQAAPVFAPQKGADRATVARLADRLERLALELRRDPRGRPMTGAAGGLSGGLWARFGAELVPGAAFVLDELGFDRRARSAALVVTGEGRLDATSMEGKVVGEVVGRCRRIGVPVHVVAGAVALNRDALAALGLASLCEAGTEEALAGAAARIAAEAA